MISLQASLNAIAQAATGTVVGAVVDSVMPVYDPTRSKTYLLVESVVQFGASFAALTEVMNLLLPRDYQPVIGDGVGVTFLILSQPNFLLRLNALGCLTKQAIHFRSSETLRQPDTGVNTEGVAGNSGTGAGERSKRSSVWK
jgi:hypothetical protein